MMSDAKYHVLQFLRNRSKFVGISYPKILSVISEGAKLNVPSMFKSCRLHPLGHYLQLYESTVCAIVFRFSLNNRSFN